MAAMDMQLFLFINPRICQAQKKKKRNAPKVNIDFIPLNIDGQTGVRRAERRERLPPHTYFFKAGRDGSVKMDLMVVGETLGGINGDLWPDI